MIKLKVVLLVLLFLILSIGCANVEIDSATYQKNDELVVLAHGLGRSDTSMWRITQRLESAKYKVCRLDYSTIGKSVDHVLTQTSKQIDNCIGNASKIHFVGHSLGGLVIRAYLQNNEHTLENGRLGEVVLIGTPNQGSEVADHLNESWLMDVGGGISRSLVTGSNSLGNSLSELNANIGVMAGTKPSSLTSEVFNGPNDGLVSVESTKLKNMDDFITIDVGHSAMRYNVEVAKQTVHFLKNGSFNH